MTLRKATRTHSPFLEADTCTYQVGIRTGPTLETVRDRNGNSNSNLRRGL